MFSKILDKIISLSKYLPKTKEEIKYIDTAKYKMSLYETREYCIIWKGEDKNFYCIMPYTKKNTIYKSFRKWDKAKLIHNKDFSILKAFVKDKDTKIEVQTTIYSDGREDFKDESNFFENYDESYLYRLKEIDGRE